MTTRGVKTKVNGSDGSDYSYRQTIEDKYMMMAGLKQQVRLSLTINKPFFIVSIFIIIAQYYAYFTNNKQLLAYHPPLNNMSPLPSLSFHILAAFITTGALSAIQQSTQKGMLLIAALFTLLISIITVVLPIILQQTAFTNIDYAVILIHVIGVLNLTWGLINGLRFSQVATAKREKSQE